MKRTVSLLLAFVLLFCVFALSACDAERLTGDLGDIPIVVPDAESPEQDIEPELIEPELPPLPDPEELPVPPIQPETPEEPAPEQPGPTQPEPEQPTPPEEVPEVPLPENPPPEEPGNIEEEVIPEEELPPPPPPPPFYTPGLEFFYTNNETAFIVAIGNADASGGPIVIPITYNGLPVIGIRNYGFDGCRDLTAIELPESLLFIGGAAFRNAGLNTIAIPESVEEIGVMAFYGCQALAGIDIPSSVKLIGDDAFTECESLETLTVNRNNLIYKSNENCLIVSASNTLIFATGLSIPEGVETVSRVFTGNRSLTTIKIPETVKHIANEAFANCTALVTVEYSSLIGLESIGENAFYNCTSLKKILSQPITTTTIGDGAFYGCESLEFYVINKNVTSIGYRAFWNCTKLKKIEMRATFDTLTGNIFGDTIEELIISNVKVIGENAFRNYAKLKSLTITYDYEDNTRYGSLKNIGYAAFYNCTNLTEVLLDQRGINPFESIGEYAFADCTALKVFNIEFSEAYKLKTIGERAFYNCTALTDFKLDAAASFPDLLLDKIEKEAFANCDSLTTVIIPNVKELGERAYAGAGFKGLILPKDLVTVGNEAFAGCKNLDAVSFAVGSKLASIDKNMFKDCTALKRLDIPNAVVSIGAEAFRHMGSIEYIYVESGSKLKSIGEYAFAGCGSLKEVSFTVGSEDCNLEVIGKSAFEGCVNLQKFLPAEKLKTIESYAFYDCKGLLGFYMSSTLTEIGAYAFYGCGSLYNNRAEMKIPAGITDLSAGVFQGCISLESVSLPASLSTIGKDAFNSCKNLTTMKLPDTLTQIGDRAFWGCANFQVPNNNYLQISQKLLNGLGKSVFEGCYNLRLHFTVDSLMTSGQSNFDKDSFTKCGRLEITVASDVTVIPSYMFQGMTGLAAVNFAANSKVQRIEHSAFFECVSLKEIWHNDWNMHVQAFPYSVTYIGDGAFSGTALTSVYFYDSLTSLQREAFSNNSYLKSVTFAKSSKLQVFDLDYFKNCPSIEELTLPEAVAYIGENYLAPVYGSNYPSSAKIKKMYIRGRVKTIDNFAFYNLKTLEIFDFGDYEDKNGGSYYDLEIIGKNAFAGCENFKECSVSNMVYIPKSVKTIDEGAFYNCKSLTGISFLRDSQIETIGNSAFWGCVSMKSVMLGYATKLTTIGESAFYNCFSVSGIIIPSSVTSVKNFAFYNWGTNQIITIDGGKTTTAKWNGQWLDYCAATIQYA